MNTSQAFVFELPVNAYRKQLHTENDVKVLGSVAGKPELPEWLKLYHDERKNRIYLYGTGPSADPINIDLVIKTNNSYESITDSIKLEFAKKQGKFDLTNKSRHSSLTLAFIRLFSNQI